jgi:RNA-directed DNA polymerase
VWLAGWHRFFGIAAAGEEYVLRALDAHIRRRLRAIVLKHWKRRRTIARNLVALGVKRQSAWQQVYAGHKSTWALSHSPAVDKAMPVRYFTARGLTRLVDLHRDSRRNVIAPVQPQLALEWG